MLCIAPEFLSKLKYLAKWIASVEIFLDIYALTLGFKLMLLFKILKILCDMELPSPAQGRRWPLLGL